MSDSQLAAILLRSESEILAEWIAEQAAADVARPGAARQSDLQRQCTEFLDLLVRAAQQSTDAASAAFAPVRDNVARLSRQRAEQGYTAPQTATFVFSLKRPLFARIRQALTKDPDGLFREIWVATEMLDRLGLQATEEYQRSREAVISRQQAEMLELSTPVVKLWEGVLALPLIGTLDSQRTQTVMESLLQRVMETGSEVVIIDITGVPTVDTLVAQHLLKTVSAARFMGVDCIISGIRPQIAQTIVHLGVALGDVITKANLSDAFKLALNKRGMVVTTKNGNGGTAHPAPAPSMPGPAT